MKRHLVLTQEPIAEEELLRHRAWDAESGAVITFRGVVRRLEKGEPIRGIEYEAFQKMVEHQFGLLFTQIETRWPIQSVKLIHRLGFVPVGEPSLWVELVAPHRGEAFAACQYLIDEMKRVVPIWKRAVVN